MGGVGGGGYFRVSSAHDLFLGMWQGFIIHGGYMAGMTSLADKPTQPSGKGTWAGENFPAQDTPVPASSRYSTPVPASARNTGHTPANRSMMPKMCVRAWIWRVRGMILLRREMSHCAPLCIQRSVLDRPKWLNSRPSDAWTRAVACRECAVTLGARESTATRVRSQTIPLSRHRPIISHSPWYMDRIRTQLQPQLEPCQHEVWCCNLSVGQAVCVLL